MPDVQLEEISFNHGAAKPGGSVTIQRAGQAITTPEWCRGNVNPRNLPVAYAIGQHKQPITIQVRLSSPSFPSTQVEVQAIADAANVLGNVQQRTVIFDAQGQSQILEFTIPAPRFAEFGVNVGTGSWSWQYQVQAGGTWIPFDTTAHQIYVLVDTPVDPWDSETPWTEVLDRSCVWANGAKTDDEAASKITSEVHSLGESQPPTLTYIRYSTYAHGTFDCLGFLDLLTNGVGSAQAINCDDCATIVSTFANILGTKLYQSEMGNFIHTHYINLIGKPKWTRPGFPRHAVAWKDPCLAADPVFDACLKLDTDGDPLDHTDFDATVPTNFPFEGANNYRFCFFRKGSCQPKPGKKRRRPLGKGFLGQIKETDEELLNLLKIHYGFETWPSEEPAIDRATETVNGLIEALPNFQAFIGWQFLAPDKFENEELVGARLFLKRNDIITRNLVDVNAYFIKQANNSNDFFLQLLAQSHQLDLKRETVNLLGRLTFVAPRDEVVLFVRRNLVVVVRSIGKESVGVFAMANAIDEFLSKRTEIKRRISRNMGHKFNGLWRCFIVGLDDDDNPQLERIGSMDLEFKPNGELKHGFFSYDGDGDGDEEERRLYLTGSASALGLRTIELESEEEDFFQGILTYENEESERLVVTGKVDFPDDSRLVRLRNRMRFQDDPPWVILKP